VILFTSYIWFASTLFTGHITTFLGTSPDAKTVVRQRLNVENIPIIIIYSKMMDMVELHLTKSGVVLLFENLNNNYIDKVVSDIQQIYKNEAYKFISFSHSSKKKFRVSGLQIDVRL